MTERVINLKSGGSTPIIREGQEVLQPDTQLMKWNTIGGNASESGRISTQEPVTSAEEPEISAEEAVVPSLTEGASQNLTTEIAHTERHNNSHATTKPTDSPTVEDEAPVQPGIFETITRKIFSTDTPSEKDETDDDTDDQQRLSESLEKPGNKHDSMNTGGASVGSLADNPMFAAMVKLFVSSNNQASLADILENIAFDLRRMRLMMTKDHQ